MPNPEVALDGPGVEQPRPARIGWMDALRGLSVSLVVVVHATGQFPISGPFGSSLHILNDLVAPLRMPTMVFLSGLLVTRSMAKGMREFLVGKVRGVVHPYVVWTAIMLALWTGPLGLMPFTWRRLVEPLWQPFDHLWFLHFLFLYYVIALVTRRVRPAIVGLGAIIAAVALTLVTGENKEFAYLAAFFMLGVDVAANSAQWSALLRSPIARLLAGTAVLILASLPFWSPAAGWYNPYVIPAVALVLVTLWHELTSRSSVPSPRVFEAIGRDSIVYYVVHWPVLVVARELVQPLHWNSWATLAVGLALAFMVSAALARARHGSAVAAALFAWPGPVRMAPLPHRIEGAERGLA